MSEQTCSTHLCSNQSEHKVFGSTVSDIWLAAGRINFEKFGDFAKVTTRENKLRNVRRTVLPRNICDVTTAHKEHRFGVTGKHWFTFGFCIQSPHSPTTANNENPRALTEVYEATNRHTDLNQTSAKSPTPHSSTHHII